MCNLDISEQEEIHRGLMHAQQMRDIQQENHHLTTLMTKMKAMSSWKQNMSRGTQARMVSMSRMFYMRHIKNSEFVISIS